MNVAVRQFDSPLGTISISATGGEIISLQIGSDTKSPANRVAQPSRLSEAGRVSNHEALNLAEQQLSEYFLGHRREFELPLRLSGTDFQRRVWSKLAEIPFGQVSSYGELAGAIDLPRAARAIGGAVGANPVPIIIGCHRVLATDGALTGYSGGSGLATKRWLLAHEGITWRS